MFDVEKQRTLNILNVYSPRLRPRSILFYLWCCIHQRQARTPHCNVASEPLGRPSDSSSRIARCDRPCDLPTLEANEASAWWAQVPIKARTTGALPWVFVSQSVVRREGGHNDLARNLRAHKQQNRDFCKTLCHRLKRERERLGRLDRSFSSLARRCENHVAPPLWLRIAILG